MRCYYCEIAQLHNSHLENLQIFNKRGVVEPIIH